MGAHSESTIVLMTGLPGTGKSTLAAALAERLSGVVLDKDRIRAALFPEQLVEYSQRQDDFCMRVLLEVAEYISTNSPTPYVFVDGRPCVLRSQLEEVKAVAARLSCRFAVIHTSCSDEIVRTRLQDPHPARNRDFAHYLQLKNRAEPMEHPYLEANTEVSLDVCINDCVAYLSGCDSAAL